MKQNKFYDLKRYIDCSDITQPVQGVQCDEVPVAGLRSEICLFNHSEVDTGGSTLGRFKFIQAGMPPTERYLLHPNIISNIVKRSNVSNAKFGYAFKSLDNASVGETSLEAGTYFNSWIHTLRLRLFAKDEDAKQFINNLRNARVIALVENLNYGHPYKFTDATYDTTQDTGSVMTKAEQTKLLLDQSVSGGTKFELYGWKGGLVITELTASTEMSDGVVYEIVMANTTSKESTVPLTLWTNPLGGGSDPVEATLSATEAHIGTIVNGSRYA
jgi:hypothetical protein